MTRIEAVEASAYEIPLDPPESDGTLTWDRTTVVAVELHAGGQTGLGVTYGPAACAVLVVDELAAALIDRDPTDVAGAWTAMVRSIRNAGRPGICSMAISAADIAMWDLKARLLELPLAHLLGATRSEVPVYASGGFTSLSNDELAEQFAVWASGAFSMMKMKIGVDSGVDPKTDLARVALARSTVGDDVELFVDANGAYGRKLAVRVGRRLDDLGVTWFEEPVSSDDIEGLREVRDAVAADVAAGEYAYDLYAFNRLLPGVDVLQADVTRCAGISEWMRASALAASFGLEISGHTAPSIHAHVACAVPNLRHLEYFVDHARADQLLFDGALVPVDGMLRPDVSRPGHGLSLQRETAERFLVARYERK